MDEFSRPYIETFLLAADANYGGAVFWPSFLLVTFAVISETALRNAKRSQMEALVADPERLKRFELHLADERSILDGLITLRLISTFLVLLSLTGLFSSNGGIGMVEDPRRFLRDLGFAFLIFVAGLFGIVRGIVRAAPERTLIRIFPVARIVAKAMLPIVWISDAIGTVVCRALGFQRPKLDEEAKQEILDAVSEGERDGAIDDEGREMIENIIDVQDQEVSQIMTPRTSVFAIPVDMPLEEAVRTVVEQGHSRMPVYSGTIDNIQGVLFAKDLLAHWQKPRDAMPTLREVMRAPHFIPETKKTSDLLNELRRDQIHLAIVIDEYGGMAGVVSIEDILEEIVGEIEDEYDRPAERAVPEVVRLNDSEAEVAGVVHIDELNEQLALTIPENEGYDTVGGFISTRLGRVPEPGESCDFENVRFEILDADARRINRVKVVVSG